MIQPNVALMGVGDIHLLRPLSYYRRTIDGQMQVLEDGTLFHTKMRKFLDNQGMRAACVGDTATDAWSYEQEQLHRAFFLGRNNDIPAMGNHDVLTVIPEDLRKVENTFENGYKNTGQIWAHEIVDDRVSVIVLHNIQDVWDPTLSEWCYANVNPPGGYAAQDWGGIASVASPQRQFLSAALADAHVHNRHVVVMGHRPAYSLSPVSIRPNHVEALAAGGYIKQLEDWAISTGRNPILLAGDVHSYCVTDPIANGVTSNNGVIHVVVSSGPSLRTLGATIQPFHRSFLYGPSVGDFNTPPVFNTSVDLSWIPTYTQLGTMVEFKWYDNHLAIETYLLCPDWMIEYFPTKPKPNLAFMIDRFRSSIINGKVTGPLVRCLPCSKDVTVI